MSRRAFLLGTGTGLAAGLSAGLLAFRGLNPQPTPSFPTPVVAKEREFGMPGRHAGRVIEVHHAASVTPKNEVKREAVRAMMERGICELTGADRRYPDEAWKTMFDPAEVIGIKVNPVGLKTRAGVVGSISSPEIVLETVRGLKSAGVPTKNIIIFERYANEFISAGYADLLRTREMDGVRWYAAAAGYTGTQLAIDGKDEPENYSSELLSHVVGYDPDAFVHMGFAAPEHSARDDRRFRSHLSLVVSKMVDKFITIPVLKDHRSSGVTLSLKNMSHGMNNNVARSHITGIAHGYPDSIAHGPISPNQCNTFIPAGVNQVAIRQKATLHILDGLIGVYEGGPGCWNKTWATWRHQSLFFATDPVAMDHVGWDILDAKRIEEGLPRVGEMGRQMFTNAKKVQMALSPLGSQELTDALTVTASERWVRGGGDSEVFDRRQPEHVYLAGSIGLGEYDLKKIVYRKLEVS